MELFPSKPPLPNDPMPADTGDHSDADPRLFRSLVKWLAEYTGDERRASILLIILGSLLVIVAVAILFRISFDAFPNGRDPAKPDFNEHAPR